MAEVRRNKVSVTVLSYNTVDLLRQCLSAVYSSELGDLSLEIVVVDNASHDGSAAMVENEFPNVRLIASDVNLGFAAGQNQAILSTHGEYVLVLNSDVILAPDAITTLAGRLSDAPNNLACVGPRVENPGGILAASGRRTRRSVPAILLAEIHRVLGVPGWGIATRLLRYLPGARHVHDNFRPETAEPVTVGYIDGMAAMFRRSALSKVGLFDEQFFFDCEIVDLGIRLSTAGFTQEYCPAVTAIHVGGASRSSNPIVDEYTNDSKIRLYAKHYPEYFGLLRAWIIALLWIRRLIDSVRGVGGGPVDLGHVRRMQLTARSIVDHEKVRQDSSVRWLPQ